MTADEVAWRRRRAVWMVVGCTVLGAAAQVLMKMGAGAQPTDSLVGLALAIITNLTLFCGYALYGVSTLMLVVALKDGQLSILYPVIAMTYVWVSVASVFLFQESMNPLKLLGLVTVVAGVGIIGRGSR